MNFTTRHCPNCNIEQSVYWELWTCDKNNEGVIPAPMPHGNSIHGMTTCEDHYCGPLTETVDIELINKEYVKTHEVHPRCTVCDHLIGE